MVHKLNGDTQYLNKNDIMLLCPQDTHSFYENTPHNHLHILISEKLFEKTAAFYDFDINEYLKGKRLVFSLEREQTDNLENIIYALQTISTDAMLQSKLTGILFRTVFDYYSLHHALSTASPRKYSNSFSKIYDIIIKKENIAKSIRELRLLCGYSQPQFYRIFMKYTGQSPVNCINHIKLNHAAHLLKTTDLKIINIAHEIGYSSISNFNTKFKEYFGVTPSRYRKSKHPY